MSFAKKLTLSLSIVVTMMIALVIGMFGNISTPKTQLDGGTVSSAENSTKVDKPTKVEVVKPATITYAPDQIVVKEGEDKINYNYSPSANAADEATTVAYEYCFGNPMERATAVNLKSIDTTDVNVSYYYSATKLDTTESITGETRYTLQKLENKGDKVYIYVIVSPTDETIPMSFTSSVVWYYGIPQDLVIENNSGEPTIQTIVMGQYIDNNTLTIPEQPVEDAEFFGWYLDEDYTIPLVGDMQVGQKIYAQFSNLPADWLELDTTTNTYRVKKGTSKLPEDLVIPSSYKNVEVTHIKDGTKYSDGVFYDNKILKRVTIPSTFTSLGDYTFYNCENLTTVNIDNCEKLTSINKHVFRNCDNLKDIQIPQNVTTIEEYAFDFCYALSNIEFPNKLTTIGNHAFYECGFTSIIIPENVTTIGNYAFESCYSLVEVYNLSGLNIVKGANTNGDVGRYAKVINTDLTTESRLKEIDNIIYYEYETSFIAIATTDESLTSIKLDNRTTAINRSAFNGLKTLTYINLPNSITSIGEAAFSGCENLANITLPSNLTTIARQTFSGCKGLTYITIPDKVTSIGYSAFGGCEGLTNISIPDKVTSIGDSVFRECKGLTNISIPDKVTSIGDHAFDSCPNLLYVEIPSSVTSIGEQAFYDSKKIKGVYIDSIESWCNITFDGVTASPLYPSEDAQLYVDGKLTTELIIPNTVTTIKDYAFYQFQNLTSVTIPESVTSIGKSVFAGCTNLTEVNLPNNLQTISEAMFSRCYSLTSITIPESVTTIGSNAFNSCYSLTEVYNLSELDMVLGETTHGGVAQYALQVYSDPTESKFTTIDGVRYYMESDDSYIAVGLVDRTKTDITLDSKTTSLKEYAFYNCDNLTSVDLSKCTNLTTLGNNIFNECDNLTIVTIPSSVQKIGKSAFYKSINLEQVIFEDPNTWYETRNSDYTGGYTLTTTGNNGSRFYNNYNYYYYHVAKCNVSLNANGGTFEGTEGETKYTFTSSLEKISDMDISNFVNHEAADNKGFAMDGDGYLVNNNKTSVADYNYTYSLVKVTFNANAGDIVGFDLTIFSTIYGGADGSGTIIFSYLDSDFAPNTDLWLDESPYRTYYAYDYESSYIAEYNIETTGEHYVMIKFVNYGYGGDSVAKIKLAKYQKVWDYTKTNLGTIDDCEVTEFSTPVRDGYTFVGWFTAPEGGTQVTEVTYNMTLYAQWRENE